MNHTTFITRHHQNRNSNQSLIQPNNYSFGDMLQAHYLARGIQLPSIQKRLYEKQQFHNAEEVNGLSITAICSQKKLMNLKSLDLLDAKLFVPERKSSVVESPKVKKNLILRRRPTHSRKLSAARLLAPIHFSPVKPQKKLIFARSEISLALKKQVTPTSSDKSSKEASNPSIEKNSKEASTPSTEKNSKEASSPSTGKSSKEASNILRRDIVISESLNELKVEKVRLVDSSQLHSQLRKRMIQTPSEEDMYGVRNIAANKSMTSFADLLDLPYRPDKTYQYMKVFDKVNQDTKRPKTRNLGAKPY